MSEPVVPDPAIVNACVVCYLNWKASGDSSPANLVRGVIAVYRLMSEGRARPVVPEPRCDKTVDGNAGHICGRVLECPEHGAWLLQDSRGAPE